MDHKKYSGIGFLSGSPRTSCTGKKTQQCGYSENDHLDKARDEETNRFKALHCLATPVLTIGNQMSVGMSPEIRCGKKR